MIAVRDHTILDPKENLMLYPFKVNMALAAMNINPTMLDGQLRSHFQQLCKAAGLTPQEAALVIVAHQLGIHFPDDVEMAIGLWRHEAKINITKPEVREALDKMGFA